MCFSVAAPVIGWAERPPNRCRTCRSAANRIFRKEMDSRLTEVLVCPVCKGPLHFDSEKSEMQCAKCALAFPLDGDIPVMLAKEAREMSRKEQEDARVKPAQ